MGLQVEYLEQFWSSSISWCEQQQCANNTHPPASAGHPQEQQLEELRQWNHQVGGGGGQLSEDSRETARAYQIRLHAQVDADGDGKVLLPCAAPCAASPCCPCCCLVLPCVLLPRACCCPVCCPACCCPVCCPACCCPVCC